MSVLEERARQAWCAACGLYELAGRMDWGSTLFNNLVSKPKYSLCRIPRK